MRAPALVGLDVAGDEQAWRAAGFGVRLGIGVGITRVV